MFDGVNILGISGREPSKYAIAVVQKFIDQAVVRQYILQPQRLIEGGRHAYPGEYDVFFKKLEGKFNWI